jgi:DNA uptake protein ComE-like DNA-binding protein
MLRELSGWPRGMLAAQIHQVTLISDYAYAFDEGWGEHLQTVAVDHTANADVQALREQALYVGEEGPYARLTRELKGRCFPCPAKLSLLLWHSQREQHLRYAGVKSNLLAHQVAVPQVLLARADPYDALLYQAIVPPAPSAPFKNGPQMLASEGLIAALFYRLVNDPRLQQSYRETAFYAPFVPPGRQVDGTQTSPQALFSPLENVYLKLFAVLARHVRLDGYPPDQSPTLLMLRGYAADYPDEAEALYDVFLEITQGVTVSPGALSVAQDWAAGRLSASEHNLYLADLRQRLLTGELALDSALPPQIWLRNPDAPVGVAVLDVYRSLPRPYHFNLNAATVADLRTVPGVDLALARQIVRVRDERGGFSSLDDVPGLSPETLDRVRRMQDAMRAYLAQGGSDPEDEIDMGTLTWSLLRWLLLGLALASTLAGLALIGGKALQAASARRLGLQSPPPGQERAAGRPRRVLRRVGWALCAVVLPVTLFFLAQVLLLASNLGHVLGIAFALALWFLAVLSRLGWGLARRGLGWRVALHRAAWGLAVYVALFLALGWLMGV